MQLCKSRSPLNKSIFCSPTRFGFGESSVLACSNFHCGGFGAQGGISGCKEVVDGIVVYVDAEVGRSFLRS